MKKLLILSGKGGTGKTTVAAAFIELLQAKAFADCDVDAPNLHLIQSQGEPTENKEFFGSKKAVIDKSKCTFCGRCASNCRFDAIKLVKSTYMIDQYACEGCGVCEYVCPTKAISLVDDQAGKLMLYQEEAVFSTAELKMGRGNSGKLVMAVKKQLTDTSDAEIAIIDGSPGIGCPVIASVSGVDMVLVVAEPSKSGISDMERILATVRHFGVKVAVCTNKADLSPDKAKEIVAFCSANEIPYLGEIPFDSEVSIAVNKGMSIVKSEGVASIAIKEIFLKTMNMMNYNKILY
ncbi:MAG: ATP-binding protein [Eubacteriales bacterium]